MFLNKRIHSYTIRRCGESVGLCNEHYSRLYSHLHPVQMCESCLANIRSTVRQRVDTESKTMPSTEALLLHWKRCEWILAMWKCATSSAIDLPGMYNTHACTCLLYTKHAFLFAAMTEYGWKRDNGRLEIGNRKHRKSQVITGLHIMWL